VATYVRGRGVRRISDAEIAELYAAGIDSDSIAARARCSGTTVLAIARAAGVEIRKPGKGVQRQRNLSDEQIISRYKAGQSGPVIADAAGCTNNTVYKVLRAYNVPIRPSGATPQSVAAATKARREREGR
jgi:hypothetical protein